MKLEHLQIGSCEVWPADSVRLTVFDVPRAPFSTELARDVEALWADMRQANPRLRGGPIWSVAKFDPTTGEIALRIDEYKHMTVAGKLPTSVVGLGVTGVLVQRDAANELRYLVGQRASDTRTYGSLWETAPRGSVEAPATDSSDQALPDLLGTLAQEAIEELVAGFPWPAMKIIGMVLDRDAASLDIVFLGEVPAQARATRPASWEYGSLQWLTTAQAQELPLSPPTQALLSAIIAAEHRG